MVSQVIDHPRTVLSLVAGMRILLKFWKSRLPWAPTILPPDLDELEGLTDVIAASRRTYDPQEENQRARKKINVPGALYRCWHIFDSSK